MRETVRRLGIEEFFVGIYGMPTKKIDNLKRAAEDSGVPASEIVFIGDGDGDYKAAQAAGCRFIGLSNDWNQWAGKSFPLIRNLGELQAIL